MVCKNLKVSVYIKDLGNINYIDILNKNCNDEINQMLYAATLNTNFNMIWYFCCPKLYTAPVLKLFFFTKTHASTSHEE